MPCRDFKILWADQPLLDVLVGGTYSLDHAPRLYESETATAMGIPLDYRWYSIGKETREQHIAARLARISIDNLLAKEATHG